MKCETGVCDKVGKEEAEALIVIDEREERIAGFAVWSWSSRVCLSFLHLLLKLNEGKAKAKS